MTKDELMLLVNHVWNPAVQHKAKSRALSWVDVKNPDGSTTRVCPAFDIAFRKLEPYDEETVRKAMYAEIEKARFPTIFHVADRCAESESTTTDESPTERFRADISQICKVTFAASDRSDYAGHVCESDPARLSDPLWYRTAIMHLERGHRATYRAGGVPYDFGKLVPLYELAATRWEAMLADPSRYAKDCLRAARWLVAVAPTEGEGELVRVLAEDLKIETQALLGAGQAAAGLF